jgi:hypothetical protein
MRRKKRVRVNVKRVNLRELYEQLFVKLDKLYFYFFYFSNTLNKMIKLKKRKNMSVKQHYIEFRNTLSKGDSTKAEEEFEKAFNKAFLYYQQKLSENKKFNLSNEEELFALVTLFDNIIGYYKEGLYEDGISYCENLIELVDSLKLKEMFKGFSLAMQKGIDIDTFFKEYVNLNKVDAEFPMFLCNFKEKIKELI